MNAAALYDDGWAIRALPPGRRDLGCIELWERSLERSRRRRALAARRIGLPVRAVSAALLASVVAVPASELAAAHETAGVATADLRIGSRTSYGQVGMGVAVRRAEIQPGDLVFWDTDGSGPSHVGIATSGSTAISATSSQGVVDHAIGGAYWGERYIGARRVG